MSKNKFLRGELYMRYKYEFEADEDFELGYCHYCPLSYVEWNDDPDDVHCVLFAHYEKCPLEEIKE